MGFNNAFSHQSRTESMPPTSGNRWQSAPPNRTPLPVGAQFQNAGFAAAGMVAEPEQVHREMMMSVHGILSLVEQMQHPGALNATLTAKFMSEHAKMMQLIKDLQPQKNAADADAAALVALDLLLAASRGKAAGDTRAVPGMGGIAGYAGVGHGTTPYAQPSMHAYVLDKNMQAVPVAQPVWMSQPMCMSYARPTSRALSVDNCLQSRPRPQPARKYTVVNPRTGEKITIRSVVPFSWRRPQRLRILDPRTGDEVLPLPAGTSTGDIEDGESAALPASYRSSRLSTDSSTSVASTGRRRRTSVAGCAVHDGRTWAIEPAGGGHWDWPLSRQEKKDRVLMLSQLELLAEIEELQIPAQERESLK